MSTPPPEDLVLSTKQEHKPSSKVTAMAPAKVKALLAKGKKLSAVKKLPKDKKAPTSLPLPHHHHLSLTLTWSLTPHLILQNPNPSPNQTCDVLEATEEGQVCHQSLHQGTCSFQTRRNHCAMHHPESYPNPLRNLLHLILTQGQRERVKATQR
jgi:hypothetical protein